MEAFRFARADHDDALDLEAFEADLHGSIVLPGSPDYDVARQVHSAINDRRPALIVRAADAHDVAKTVVLARESGLTLSVRGGGHSLAGYGTNDGGIVLDLGAMKGLHIDPDRRVAWAQPGLTAGEYTNAVAAHGLATPFGDTGSVGIGRLEFGSTFVLCANGSPDLDSAPGILPKIAATPATLKMMTAIAAIAINGCNRGGSIFMGDLLTPS